MPPGRRDARRQGAVRGHAAGADRRCGRARMALERARRRRAADMAQRRRSAPQHRRSTGRRGPRGPDAGGRVPAARRRAGVRRDRGSVMAASLREAVTNVRASSIPQSVVRPSTAAVWALGRIEARKLVLHRSFLIGMGFGLFILRGAVGSEGASMTLAKTLQWLVLGSLAGLVLGAVLSANLAALRPRRSGVQELFGAMPAPVESVTTGVLAGLALGPVVFAVCLTIVGWFAFRSDPDIGPY